MTTKSKFASERMQQVRPSASVVVSQTARQLKAEGKDIIDLGIGEPDFDTPDHIIEAAHQAALSGQTRYTPMAGTAALKQAISDKFKRDNKLNFSPDQVFVSNGAKQIIFSAMLATLNPGDEVLLCGRRGKNNLAQRLRDNGELVDTLLNGNPHSIPLIRWLARRKTQQAQVTAQATQK